MNETGIERGDCMRKIVKDDEKEVGMKTDKFKKMEWSLLYDCFFF